MKPAGFWRRLAAYTIDVLPILVLTTTVFWFVLGFDRTWRTHSADPHNLELLAQFYIERNRIRDFSFLLWLVYSTILEASPLQGTVGKLILRLKVVGPDGNRLTTARSLGRNAAKLLSYLPLSLGFLWVAVSKRKLAWHDMMSGTRVLARWSDAQNYAEPPVLTELSAAKYQVGETWKYKPRPGEEGSVLTIVRVESSPNFGVIVHISLAGLHIQNAHSPHGTSGEIAHMPFSEAAIDKSVTSLVNTTSALPHFEDGYREWRTAFDQGKGGVFTITIAEAVGYMESVLEK